MAKTHYRALSAVGQASAGASFSSVQTDLNGKISTWLYGEVPTAEIISHTRHETVITNQMNQEVAWRITESFVYRE